MDYTKKQNIPGILLFIDFEKAFDGVIRWIETLEALGKVIHCPPTYLLLLRKF